MRYFIRRFNSFGNVVSFFNRLNVYQLTSASASNSKSALCRIPKDAKFLEKKDWTALTAIEKAEHFTIGQGDIVVRGSVEDVIDEYQAGHRSTDLLSKYREYQTCLEINEYSINTGIGRNNEHYLVRGK